MKRIFTLLALSVLSAGLFAQDCSNLIFSEYVEGSGNNKAIEVYNTTDHIIDLGDYVVVRFSNGNSTFESGGSTRLQGFIESHTTFVLVNGQTTDQDLGGGSVSPKCDPVLQALGNQLDHGYPAPMYMNGNDAIGLLYDPEGTTDTPTQNAVITDLFAIVAGGMTSSAEGWAPFTDQYVYMNIYDGETVTGKDSAYISNYIVPEGYYWVPWTANHSLVRKPTVKQGVTINPAVFNVTVEWDTVPGGADQWDSLGTHTCDCATKTAVQPVLEQPKAYIYPNPSTDGHFTISSNNPVKEYEVINMLGQVILRQENRYNEMNISINIPDSRNGIYFVRIKFPDNSILTKKIVIR